MDSSPEQLAGQTQPADAEVAAQQEQSAMQEEASGAPAEAAAGNDADPAEPEHPTATDQPAGEAAEELVASADQPADQPAVEDAAEEEAASADQPAADEAAEEVAASADQPAADEHAAEETAASADQPAADEQAAEETAASADQPAAEEVAAAADQSADDTEATPAEAGGEAAEAAAAGVGEEALAGTEAASAAEAEQGSAAEPAAAETEAVAAAESAADAEAVAAAESAADGEATTPAVAEAAADATPPEAPDAQPSAGEGEGDGERAVPAAGDSEEVAAAQADPVAAAASAAAEAAEAVPDTAAAPEGDAEPAEAVVAEGEEGGAAAEGETGGSSALAAAETEAAAEAAAAAEPNVVAALEAQTEVSAEAEAREPSPAAVVAADTVAAEEGAAAAAPEGAAEPVEVAAEVAAGTTAAEAEAQGDAEARPVLSSSRAVSANAAREEVTFAAAAAIAAAAAPSHSSGAMRAAMSRTASRAAFELPDVYDKGAFMQPVDPDLQMPMEAVPTRHVLSLDAYKRNNLAYIEDDVLVTSAGNNVIFIHLSDMTHRYMPGLDGGGIGAIAVHPSRSFLAVAEKCKHRSPNVYVYKYPDLSLHRVLRSGTERAYTALAFNDRGNMLASVGGFPDYLITLWAWEDESITLRSKAFSQDVYTVRFSPYFEGLLNTSGTGHIRFWKVASTFTGLKLQGQIGKFGAVELSDVEAFVEMPDGKVLSSTETGEMLMWDGGLIKVVLTRADRRPCHDGAIQVLMHDHASNVILSGGADGVVRLWSFAKVNEAEAEEDSNHMVISPIDEIVIASGARIKTLLWERRHWLIQDEAGALYRVDLPEGGTLSKGATVTRLLQFHSGAIVGMHLSPASHTAVTAGADGSLRVYDYAASRTVAASSFAQAATALTPLGASGLILAAGFEDGVVRVVRRCADGVAMLSAYKPHKGRVTAALLSPDGHKFATAGNDGTVFFFAPDVAAGGVAAGALKPVAYTVVPAIVTCCVWSEDSRALLCGTAAGTVVEVLAPEPGSIDVSHTFEAQGLVQRTYAFKCPKPPKKKKAKKAAEGGAEDGAATGGQTAAGDGSGGDGAVPVDGTEAGEEAAGADGKASEEAEEAAEEEQAQAEEEVPRVLAIRLPPGGGGSGEFLLTLDGKAAGTVWRCSLDAAPEEPAAPFAPACGATSLLPGLVIPAPAPTTYFAYAGGRQELLVMGSADGVVRVQRAAPSGGVSGGDGAAWQAPLHDMQEGGVAAVAVSFDGAYLLSAAADGTLYVQEMRLGGAHEPQPSGDEPLPALADCVAVTADIVNASEYTIEEAKQKAEQDALMAAAEQKKMGVREYLQQIRKEFEAMLAENQARPESERLPRSEFEIDPGLREMMEQEAQSKEQAARMEMAWETEKRRLALAKLKAFFLDKVEVERVVLHALQSKTFVTTFRTAKLPTNIQEELKEAQRQQQAEQEAAMQEAERSRRSTTGARGDGTDSMAGGPLGLAGRKSGLLESATSGVPDSDTSRMTKADLRRLARKKREAEWAAFTATKPDDKYENPADVAAIEEAERNMGDFKLKSDPNYVIPEELRMTPQRKRLQMLLLEEAIYKVKMGFNRKFLALRDVKKKVVAEINARLGQLKDINVQLAAKDGAAVAAAAAAGAGQGAAQTVVAGFASDLALKPEEQPEMREVVTEEDLEEFARKKEEEKKAAQAGGALGGFAGGSAAAPAAKRAPAGSGPKAGAPGAKAGGGADHGHAAAAAAAAADEALAKMMAAVPLTEFEKSLHAFQRKRLEHERAKLQEEVAEMVEAFDEALGSLRREKFKLESDVKMAEMKQLVHYQELVLLRDFDKREVVLIQKRQAKLDDRKEIMDKIAECNNKLEQKRVELDGLMSRRASVLAEFDALVPESDPFREPLSKIFMRRIKRSKKRAAADDEDGDEEEEEDEDGEEGDEDDDDDDEESLYERVCEQREKRLDEDDLITEFQKTIEVVKKEKETAAKKQKVVEQGLAAIQQEITEFQREKQGRLNQIDVVVNLKMHQIEYLVDGRLPTDLTQGLVFSDKELEKLKRRIEELDQEKADLRAKQKALKKEHLQLLRDKRAKEARVSELEAKAYDVQMLKFGQVIDLDLLDRIGASKGTEDLKEQLKVQEAQYAKELVEWDKKIAARTDELVALTRENTNCLNAVSELTVSQRKLESSLATARTTMFSDPVVQRKQEVEERDQLVQLVNAQAAEIQKLKAQINALHRKDTSVYQ